MVKTFYGIIGSIIIYGSLIILISLKSSIDIQEKNKWISDIVMAQLFISALSKFFNYLYAIWWLCMNRTNFYFIFNLDLLNILHLSMGKEGQTVKKYNYFRYSIAFLIYPFVLSITIAAIEWNTQPNTFTSPLIPSTSFDFKMFSKVLNNPLFISMQFIVIFSLCKNLIFISSDFDYDETNLSVFFQYDIFSTWKRGLIQQQYTAGIINGDLMCLMEFLWSKQFSMHFIHISPSIKIKSKCNKKMSLRWMWCDYHQSAFTALYANNASFLFDIISHMRICKHTPGTSTHKFLVMYAKPSSVAHFTNQGVN